MNVLFEISRLDERISCFGGMDYALQGEADVDSDEEISKCHSTGISIATQIELFGTGRQISGLVQTLSIPS